MLTLSLCFSYDGLHPTFFTSAYSFIRRGCGITVHSKYVRFTLRTLMACFSKYLLYFILSYFISFCLTPCYFIYSFYIRYYIVITLYWLRFCLTQSSRSSELLGVITWPAADQNCSSSLTHSSRFFYMRLHIAKIHHVYVYIKRSCFCCVLHRQLCWGILGIYCASHAYALYCLHFIPLSINALFSSYGSSVNRKI